MRKGRLEDLAIFGGAAAFERPLYVGAPNTGDRERLLRRINDLLDRGRLTNNGPYVHEFEQRIAALLGVEHFVAVSSGTVALELVARATGLAGEVIVPAGSWFAG